MKVYILEQYKRDLTASLSGSLEVIPSRSIGFSEAALGQYEVSALNDMCTDINDRSGDAFDYGADKIEGYYYAKMDALWGLFFSISEFGRDNDRTQSFRPDGTTVDSPDTPVNLQDVPSILSLSDVNYVGSDISNGKAFYEMVMVVNPQDASSFVPAAGCIVGMDILGEPPEHEPGSVVADAARELVTGAPVRMDNTYISNHPTISIPWFLITYDIKHGDTIVVRDMPGLIVVPDSPLNIVRQDDQLLGGGTQLAVRISLSLDAQGASIQVGDAGDTYNTLTKVLETAGKCLDEMNRVTASHMHQLNDIKAYLTNFKDDQKANIPYIKQIGNARYWAVNGKIIAKV